MKKNRSMRVGVSLAIATLITTCLIGGTFAQYVTSAADEVSARVAGWGFEKTGEINIDGLFAASYDNVTSSNTENVIAPGTSGEVSFGFAYDAGDTEAPEVGYTFKVDTSGSLCDQGIQDNENIRFYLDDEDDLLTWTELMAALKLLSGDASGQKTYTAGSLPAEFSGTENTHTVGWQWIFRKDDAGDLKDTALGNEDELSDIKLSIAITAAQVD